MSSAIGATAASMSFADTPANISSMMVWIFFAMRHF